MNNRGALAGRRDNAKKLLKQTEDHFRWCVVPPTVRFHREVDVSYRYSEIKYVCVSECPFSGLEYSNQRFPHLIFWDFHPQLFLDRTFCLILEFNLPMCTGLNRPLSYRLFQTRTTFATGYCSPVMTVGSWLVCFRRNPWIQCFHAATGWATAFNQNLFPDNI